MIKQALIDAENRKQVAASRKQQKQEAESKKSIWKNMRQSLQKRAFRRHKATLLQHPLD
jgi:hypothetical protein